MDKDKKLREKKSTLKIKGSFLDVLKVSADQAKKKAKKKRKKA